MRHASMVYELFLRTYMHTYVHVYVLFQRRVSFTIEDGGKFQAHLHVCIC